MKILQTKFTFYIFPSPFGTLTTTNTRLISHKKGGGGGNELAQAKLIFTILQRKIDRKIIVLIIWYQNFENPNTVINFTKFIK